MLPDGFVHSGKLLRVNLGLWVRPAYNFRFQLVHIIAQQGLTGMVKQVTAVFRGIRNDAVHLEQFLSGDSVGNQRGLVLRNVTA